MVTIKQLKTGFDKRNNQYSEEFTTGNYDDNGNVIDRKIPTLITEYCEIGFDDQVIYLVFIAQSSSWSKEFFGGIKKFKNLKVYGFKNFLKDYDLTINPESEIRNEPVFQMQFSFKNTSNLTEVELLSQYDSIIEFLKGYQIKIIDQLKKVGVL